MIDLILALSLYFAAPRPQNWQAGIGIVQDVRLITNPDGRVLVSLRYSDGRIVQVDNGVLYGPQASSDYHAPPDQILSWGEAERSWTEAPGQ